MASLTDQPLTDPAPTPPCAYPLDPPSNDLRFTFGLIIAAAEVLTGAGYPELTPGDLVDLRQTLFRSSTGR